MRYQVFIPMDSAKQSACTIYKTVLTTDSAAQAKEYARDLFYNRGYRHVTVWDSDAAYVVLGLKGGSRTMLH